MFLGTLKSLELCHPALSTIKAICSPGFISFDNSDKNIFIATVLAYGNIKPKLCPVE